MAFPFRNRKNLLLLIALCLVQSALVLTGYGQLSSREDFVLQLKNGTSAPCPAPEAYSPVRPDPPGTPTSVGVGMVFLQVLNIADVDESFEVDVYKLFYWKDSRLADSARGAANALCELPDTGFWTPQVDFINLRDSEEKGATSALIDAEGNVMVVGRYYMSFTNPMDLREFPFDQQILRITGEPLLENIDEVQLYPLRNYVQKADELVVNGWALTGPEAQSSVRYAPLRGTEYSRLEISLEAERDTGFFRRKLIIPMALIVCMSWTIFWLSPSQTAPQLALGATSMLTLIAYQFALGNMLPRISYLTRADEFILGSLILVFLALVEAAATAVLVNRGMETTAVRVDQVCRVVLPLAYASIIALTLLV